MSIYFDILKFNLARTLVYPYEVISVFVRRFVNLTMLLLFWTILAKSSDIKVNPRELASYFLIADAVSEIIMTSNLNFGRNIQKLIKSGALTNYTIKPLNTVYYLFFSHVGERGVAFLVASISLTVGILINPPTTMKNILLFFIYLIFAIGMSFGINILIAVIGFLTPEAGGIKNVVVHMLRIFSGALIPLTYFPNTIREILLFTPFPYLIFGPANALNSSSILDSFNYIYILTAFLWSIILPIIAIQIWNILFKKYEAIGI